MVSDLLLPSTRLLALKLIAEQREFHRIPEFATKLFEFGTGAKGYWKGEEIVQYVLEVAVPVFEAVYPGY
jgi:hypothetical protein